MPLTNRGESRRLWSGRTLARSVCAIVAVTAGCGCSSSASSKPAAASAENSRVTSTSGAHHSVASSSTTARRVTTTSRPKAAKVTTSSSGPAATTSTTIPPIPATTPSTNPVVASDLSNAEQVVRGKGFTPTDAGDFTKPPVDGLHVILATATGSADGHTQQAFFFVHGQFRRTDLPGPSAGIHIAWRNETTIALAYALYQGKEAACCPTGGSMIVRYQWTGTHIEALDPIPPATLRR